MLIGWTNALENGDYFADQDSAPVTTKAEYDTLYAVWLKVPECYAVFCVNGYFELQDCYASIECRELQKTYYSVEIDDDFVMPALYSQAFREFLTTVWKNTADDNLYFSNEKHKPVSGARYVVAELDIHWDMGRTFIFDGNGGVYRRDDRTLNRVIYGQDIMIGAPVYPCRFTRPGYTLIGYNSKPDGSGTEYTLDQFAVTADMERIQVLYAQWKPAETEAGEGYISVDGIRYDAAENHQGSG